MVFKNVFILLVLFFIPSSFGIIHTITTHHEIFPYLDKDSEVVFDIDETIVFIRSLFYHPQGKKFRSHMSHLMSEHHDSEMLFSLLFKNCEIGLIESDFSNVFKKIKKMVKRTMACTSRSSTLIGTLSTARLISEQLKNFGIDFKATDGTSQFLTLEDFTCEKKEGCAPEWYEDILFTQGRDKGPALLLLFKQLNFVPKKVVFVDDLERNIHSVHEALTAAKIPCVCLHYKRNPPYKTWKEEVVHYQVKYLLKYHQWLSDNEAEKQIHELISRKDNADVL